MSSLADVPRESLDAAASLLEAAIREGGKVLVADARGRQRPRQRLAVELRVPERPGNGADVDDQRDRHALEQRDELRRGARGVADGEEGGPGLALAHRRRRVSALPL